jgi:hypothetical protein
MLLIYIYIYYKVPATGALAYMSTMYYYYYYYNTYYAAVPGSDGGGGE